MAGSSMERSSGTSGVAEAGKMDDRDGSISGAGQLERCFPMGIVHSRQLRFHGHDRMVFPNEATHASHKPPG